MVEINSAESALDVPIDWWKLAAAVGHVRMLKNMQRGKPLWSVGCRCGWKYPTVLRMPVREARRVFDDHLSEVLEAMRGSEVSPP